MVIKATSCKLAYRKWFMTNGHSISINLMWKKPWTFLPMYSPSNSPLIRPSRTTTSESRGQCFWTMSFISTATVCLCFSAIQMELPHSWGLANLSKVWIGRWRRYGHLGSWKINFSGLLKALETLHSQLFMDLAIVRFMIALNRLLISSLTLSIDNDYEA